MHEVCDELLQTALLVYYYHGWVKYLLENPNVAIVLEKHSEEAILKVPLEHVCIFLTELKDIALQVLVFLTCGL